MAKSNDHHVAGPEAVRPWTRAAGQAVEAVANAAEEAERTAIERFEHDAKAALEVARAVHQAWTAPVEALPSGAQAKALIDAGLEVVHGAARTACEAVASAARVGAGAVSRPARRMVVEVARATAKL